MFEGKKREERNVYNEVHLRLSLSAVIKIWGIIAPPPPEMAITQAIAKVQNFASIIWQSHILVSGGCGQI